MPAVIDAKHGKRRRRSSDPDVAGIRTLHIAAKILDALAEYREPVRVTDLARKLGMTMPTVSRHLTTWRELGFVDKPEGHETYRLGVKLFSLGNAAAEQNSHVSIAYPFLIALRDKTQETTAFVSRIQGQPTVLVCLDSGRPTTVIARPGTVLSLPYSPTARLLWAFRPNTLQELEEVAAKLDYSEFKGWSATLFKKKIRAAFDNWLDYEADVLGDGIGGVCAPIFGHDDKIVGAVTVIRPSFADKNDPKPALVSDIQKCAADISAALGSKTWSMRAPRRNARKSA